MTSWTETPFFLCPLEEDQKREINTETTVSVNVNLQAVNKQTDRIKVSHSCFHSQLFYHLNLPPSRPCSSLQEAVELIVAALTSSLHINHFLYGTVRAVSGAKHSKQPLFSGNIPQSLWRHIQPVKQCLFGRQSVGTWLGHLKIAGPIPLISSTPCVCVCTCV